MITIIIPTIGRSETIERALIGALNIPDSLVTQVIIVDNSQSPMFSDYLNVLIEKYRDPRVLLISLNERKTMAQSWNSAIPMVKSSWILYLHDDDELLDITNNSAGIEDALKENGDLGFISFDYHLDYTDSLGFKKRRHVKRSEFRGAIDFSIINDCPKFVSTLINKHCLEKIGCWRDDYGYFLDLMAFLELHYKSNSIFIDIPLGVYYLHDENESSLDRRSREYGDYIPPTVEKFFSMCSESSTRRFFLKSISDFVYPVKRGWVRKSLNKIFPGLV